MVVVIYRMEIIDMVAIEGQVANFDNRNSDLALPFSSTISIGGGLHNSKQNA